MKKAPNHLMCFARPGFLLAVLACSAPFVGCGDPNGVAPQIDIDAARQRLVLHEEPDGAMTVLGLRDQEGGFSEGKVVLVGQIGGMPNPFPETDAAFPWREGEASFFLVDPSTVAEFAGHEHADGEDHADCAFCKHRAESSAGSVAAVSFNGQNGKPLPVGAQELFDIKAKDIVVVTGTAKRIGGGLLVVDAEGLYVRR